MTAYRRETIAWGLLTLGGFACLPWERVGKAFFALSWPYTGLARASTAWPLALVGLAACLAIALGIAGSRDRRGGWAILAGAACGLLVGILQLAATGRAFGLGAVVSLLGLLTLAGIGLAQVGLVRGGPFVGAGILWSAGLIILFILFPLVIMLQASIVIQGNLTAAGLLRYLRSPIFLLLRHPELTVDPIRWGARVGIGTGLIAAAIGLFTVAYVAFQRQEVRA